MKTILVSSARVPDDLHDILKRGSTTLDSLPVRDADPGKISRLSPDRVVFWHETGDRDVEILADAMARRDPGEAATAIVFISSGTAGIGQWLAPDQVFIWPKDEDRLAWHS